MNNPFKKFPTLEEVAIRVANIHGELRALNEGAGQRIAQVEQSIQENNELTDGALEELNLKVAFLMTMLAIKTPKHAGLMLNGEVQYEQKPALQVYLESGRAKMIAQREAALRAQGLSTAADGHPPAENAPTASAAAPEAIPAPGPKVH